MKRMEMENMEKGSEEEKQAWSEQLDTATGLSDYPETAPGTARLDRLSIRQLMRFIASASGKKLFQIPDDGKATTYINIVLLVGQVMKWNLSALGSKSLGNYVATSMSIILRRTALD
ncbi:hypothetical protein RRG08_043998 [Elysia crispata]|uniref:Uncharacterized protein n=1 Tax=Elysia crispata TaxID=231223 RepID=A0AAE0Y1V1_9GAST|nr:hypothetical protein RRG08_043998 [Elysia crispata]